METMTEIDNNLWSGSLGQTSTANPEPSSIVHLVIMGELEVNFFSLDRNTILAADLDPINSETESLQLGNDIGETLAEQARINLIHSDLASLQAFVSKVAIYISRLNILGLMQANNENTLILTIFKSATQGSFHVRVAGTAKTENLDEAFKATISRYITENPAYLQDNYDPDSVYHVWKRQF